MTTEFDLIPSDYKKRLRMRHLGLQGAFTLGCILSTTLLLHLSITWLSEKNDQEIVELQHQQAISVQQRNLLSELTDRKLFLDERLKFLSGLRGGAIASTMFITIDKAMSTRDVWFEQWEFQRAGYVVEEPLEGRNTGYFIIIPEESREESTQAWMIETHMSINGRALNHSALSSFVGRLFKQHAIEDVRILNSKLAPTGQYVEFNLAIIVNNFEATGNTFTDLIGMRN